MIGKTKDAEAIAFKPFGACSVVSQFFIRSMLAAVEFDDEFSLEAREVGDVGANWLPAAEFEIVETPSAQCEP
jgi:hypothetical protein